MQEADDDATEEAEAAVQALALDRGAALGRAAPAAALPLVASLLAEKQAVLLHSSPGGATPLPLPGIQ